MFDDNFVKPGTHINGVGSYKTTMAEMPPEAIVRAKVVDPREGSLVEASDLIQPIDAGVITRDHIHGESGELVVGKIPAREDDKEITVFKSVGVAVQDLVTANLALQLTAEKTDMGISLEI